MEAVLHIEPIIRNHHYPLSVGYTDYLFYGESEDEDPTGNYTSYIRLGCPLEELDHGSKRSHVPLIKTIEYMPDFTRNSGYVYTETIHYFKDHKFLIPIRTKIHSGLSQGLRIAHLPSLNYSRKDLSGVEWDICDARAEIVSGLLDYDSNFLKQANHPVMDWLRYDLTNILSKSTVTDIRFGADRLTQMVGRFSHHVLNTPHEVNTHHLKDLYSIIGLENNTLPRSYQSEDVIGTHILDVKDRLVNHHFDFKCHGSIPVEKLPRIDYNPFAFQSVLGILDRLPLTDFNIDIILNTDNSISFIHENIVTNRLGVFADNEIGAFSSESLMSDIVDEKVLSSILEKFVKYHSAMNEEILDIIINEPVKMKIIKTISDEALILLYKYNSRAKDEPLCGVYFDIALQSLAPLTIIPEIQV